MSIITGKVDLKSDSIWRSTVHEEMKEMPDAFTSRNVVSIQILFDFIVASSKLHGDAIMAFVHILENILHSLDCGNTLDVDVATIFQDEIGTISDDPAIVDLLSPNLRSVASVATSGRSI